jgi:hypothetical protein
MEGLHLFDQAAFEWVRSARDYLFAEGRFTMVDDEVKNAFGKDFREMLPVQSRDQIVELLCALFPQRAKVLSGRGHFFGEAEYETIKRRGIGSEAGYDAYFGLFPSPNAVPKSVIDSVVTRLEDQPFIASIFQQYLDQKSGSGKPLVGDLMDELRYRLMGREPIRPTQQLLNAVLLAGDAITRIERDQNLVELSPQASFSFLVKTILEGWPVTEAAAHLQTSLEQSNSIVACALIFLDRARELGLMPSSGYSQPVITKEDIVPLGKWLLQMIQSADANGTLENAPFYWATIDAWNFLSGPTEPRAWILRNLEANPAFLPKLAKGMLIYSISSSERKYSMREPPDATLFDSQVLLDISKKRLTANVYVGEDKSIVTALFAGLSGIPTEGRKRSSDADV